MPTPFGYDRRPDRFRLASRVTSQNAMFLTLNTGMALNTAITKRGVLIRARR